ncbi:MAG: hypothetical protein AAGI17_06205 [Planctomycetota bacterium]
MTMTDLTPEFIRRRREAAAMRLRTTAIGGLGGIAALVVIAAGALDASLHRVMDGEHLAELQAQHAARTAELAESTAERDALADRLGAYQRLSDRNDVGVVLDFLASVAPAGTEITSARIEVTERDGLAISVEARGTTARRSDATDFARAVQGVDAAEGVDLSRVTTTPDGRAQFELRFRVAGREQQPGVTTTASAAGVTP